MMNIKLALIVSVSAYALQMNPVYASLLSSPPASILDTNIHTPPRLAAHPQGVASQTCHNVQSSAPASFSSVILGLDPNIKKDCHPELVEGSQPKQFAEMLRHEAKASAQHDSSFLSAGTMLEHRASGQYPSAANFPRPPVVASVCFITDTGACSGNSFNSGANTEDGGHGAPGGGSGDNGGTGDDSKDPDYELNNAERCKKEGYTLTSCNSVQDSVNHCPYDNSYFEKCVCKSGLVTCTKPQYGVGDVCGGKYASCQTDNPRACKEDGYTNTCVTGQKLRKDRRCQYDSSFGICCTESCATNTALTCTGADAGDDGCGYTCKQCCVTSCPSGYDYTESQLTGANGNGWVKDGTDYCDHCTKGRLYKRKAATCSVSQTCSCGGSDKCKSGNNTYYSSCNCCSNCSGATSHSGMAYYNSCYNSCTKQTLYTERSCDNSCEYNNSYSCGSDYDAESYTNECGNTCYRCKYCACKNTTRSSCPVDHPYEGWEEDYDSCGYSCGPKCYDSKSYVEVTMEGCRLYKASVTGYTCKADNITQRYEIIRYDGASRWENDRVCYGCLSTNFENDHGQGCSQSSPTEEQCCSYCLAHPPSSKDRWWTGYANF